MDSIKTRLIDLRIWYREIKNSHKGKISPKYLIQKYNESATYWYMEIFKEEEKNLEIYEEKEKRLSALKLTQKTINVLQELETYISSTKLMRKIQEALIELKVELVVLNKKYNEKLKEFNENFDKFFEAQEKELDAIYGEKEL